MTEEQHRMQELRLKRLNTLIAVIGAIGVIASIYFGFSQLVSQSKVQAQATEAQTATIKDQWSRRFYDEKLAVYSRATEAAARLAALKSMGAPANQIEEAKMQFKVLFWGPMCITEDDDVESAMVLFQCGVDACATPKQVEDLSLFLAHLCKNEAHRLYLPSVHVASRYGSNPEILERMKKIISDAKCSQKQPCNDSD
jgi:hypothetical protein